MSEINHRLVLYIVILVMAMSSVFFYSRWDNVKKEKASIESRYKTEQTIGEIEQKTQKILQQTLASNIELQKKLVILDKRLTDLRKIEGNIKPPSEEQLNAIKKNDVKVINDTFNKLGYSTTIVK